jgi:arylsulfatase
MRNILLITADHMRHDALGCNGNEWVHTPNLDRMASLGITFSNSFSPNPICVPARASITTGRYSHKCTGLKRNSGRIKGEQATLARHFSSLGFDTYAIGKMHYVPYARPGEPRLLHGFRYAELCEEGRILRLYDPEGKVRGLEDYHDYLHDVGWGGYERAHGTGNNDIHPAPSPLPAEHHEEAWVAERAMTVLRNHLEHKDGRPFLMWASFTKPHPPYDAPAPYNCMYDPRSIPSPVGSHSDLTGRDRELIRRRTRYGWDRLSPQGVQLARAHYYGLVSFQDAMVGRLLRFVEEAGLMDDTIVIYTADHGDLLGDFGSFFKTCMFDGAVKVPFILCAPNWIPAGEVRHQLVGTQDILPTLCTFVGAESPRHLDGMDLHEVLRSDGCPGRKYFFSQTMDSPNQKYMVRSQEWKYVYCEEGGTEELYDVQSDPAELRNLACDTTYETVVKQLRDVLVQWCIFEGDEQMVCDGELVRSAPIDLASASFEDQIMGWRWY